MGHRATAEILAFGCLELLKSSAFLSLAREPFLSWLPALRSLKNAGNDGREGAFYVLSNVEAAEEQAGHLLIAADL